MKLFKLTDKDNETHGGTLWGAGVSHRLHLVTGPRLCSGDVIHAYDDLNLALLLNPIHGAFEPFHIWEAEGEVVVRDWGKVGCFELTTVKQISPPDWWYDQSSEVIKRFAQFCLGEAPASVSSLAREYYPCDYDYSTLCMVEWIMRGTCGDAVALAARAVEVVCER